MSGQRLLTRAESAAYLRQSPPQFDRYVRPYLARSRHEPGMYYLWELDEFIERAKTNRVYFIEAEGVDRIKIGWTARSVAARLAQLQRMSPVRLSVLGSFFGDATDERRAHALFANVRVGTSEWFEASDELRAVAHHARAGLTPPCLRRPA